jgi:hypothetical protein
MPSSNRLKPFKFRITIRGVRNSYTFYAPNQATANSYAKAWARRKSATKLTRIKKGES